MGKADSSGTSTYRRDGADVTAPVLSDGSAVYTPGVSQRRGGATTYDLADRLGTAARQSGAPSTLTATRSYDAFGMLQSTTGTPQGPFGFAGTSGYQEDGDSGLKLLGHRYYDPSTGRFLTRDPARDGRNWYAYCEGNPLICLDPEGFQATTIVRRVIWEILEEMWGSGGTALPNPPINPVTGAGFDPGTGGGGTGERSTPSRAGEDFIVDTKGIVQHPTVTNSKGGNDKGRGDDPAWKVPIDELKRMIREALASGNSKRARDLQKILKQRGKKPRDGSQG